MPNQLLAGEQDMERRKAHDAKELRDLSRQMYLTKREQQKLDELRDKIEDEERLFAVRPAITACSYLCACEAVAVKQMSRARQKAPDVHGLLGAFGAALELLLHRVVTSVGQMCSYHIEASDATLPHKCACRQTTCSARA